MAGSTYGQLFRVTTWGESHGKALGAVIDGCPADLSLCEEDIQKFLDRRKPGQSSVTTSRAEGDRCRILSGVFEGKTTGTPISVIVENTSQKSSDYKEIASYYRPGHADFTYDKKYGFRDYRGGGRSSGRETIGRVIGGAIASRVLEELGVGIKAFTQSIGSVAIDYDSFNLDACMDNVFYMPDNKAALLAEGYVKELMAAGDSAGGIISCIIEGICLGIGEPVFDKLDAELSKAIMSIGAVKGIEFGAGFAVGQMSGSQNNDEFITTDDGKIKKRTNNAGGILGGMSDGSEIIFNAAIKPTPSISKTQQTVNQAGEPVEICIHGRHDPVIVPRAVVVVEAMSAMVVLDMMLRNIPSKMDTLKRIYS